MRDLVWISCFVSFEESFHGGFILESTVNIVNVFVEPGRAVFVIVQIGWRHCVVGLLKDGRLVHVDPVVVPICGHVELFELHLVLPKWLGWWI